MQLLKSDLNPYSKVFLVKGKEGNPASRTASKMSSRFFRVLSVSFLASLVWLALLLLSAFVLSESCSFVTRLLCFFVFLPCSTFPLGTFSERSLLFRGGFACWGRSFLRLLLLLYGLLILRCLLL